jgi:hypothetical protein
MLVVRFPLGLAGAQLPGASPELLNLTFIPNSLLMCRLLLGLRPRLAHRHQPDQTVSFDSPPSPEGKPLPEPAPPPEVLARHSNPIFRMNGRWIGYATLGLLALGGLLFALDDYRYRQHNTYHRCMMETYRVWAQLALALPVGTDSEAVFKALGLPKRKIRLIQLGDDHVLSVRPALLQSECHEADYGGYAIFFRGNRLRTLFPAGHDLAGDAIELPAALREKIDSFR